MAAVHFAPKHEGLRSLRGQPDKRGNKKETTLRQFFREYMERHVRVHNRRPGEIERTFRIYVKPLASRRLSRITHRDVQGLHVQVGRDRGQYAANRMLA